MNYEEAKKKIKKIIQGMSGKYSRYNIFMDFINLTAWTISNGVDKTNFDEREAKYMQVISKYTREEADKFAEMFALMIMAYERQMGDFIGELYMTMEFSNRDTGQFFTPYHVSQMMTKLLGTEPGANGLYTINEPSSGSGGMMVAFAELLKKNDINYQEKLRVVCNDLDYDVVKMCYIQLSLLGIDAIVYQKNTLAPVDDPPGEVWYTPMHIINLQRDKERQSNDNAHKMLNAMRKLQELEKPIEKEPVKELVGVIPGQTSIFDFL